MPVNGDPRTQPVPVPEWIWACCGCGGRERVVWSGGCRGTLRRRRGACWDGRRERVKVERRRSIREGGSGAMVVTALVAEVAVNVRGAVTVW